MISRMKCRLCDNLGEFFSETQKRNYYRCARCGAVFMDPACHVLKEQEKKRYQEHNNDVEDPGYQKFVYPIVEGVERAFKKNCLGLDFGAGTGPVTAKLLHEKGYRIELYDPFFFNNKNALKKKYDFVFCCEVIEHFHFPAKEFSLLKSLLKPEGVLFCMTELYSEGLDFDKWYYKNDPTHVFFYHHDTLEYIKGMFSFSGVEASGRLIKFLV